MPLILDWHPDYWTSDERSHLFDFWRDRYGRHPLNLSPSGAFAGGVGFFDAGLQSVRFQTNVSASDPTHPLTQAFHDRQALLRQESVGGQAADRHRLQLLMVAEQAGWEWWKVFETYRPRLFDGPVLRQQSSERIQRHEAVFKDALAQLIEHDREHGHPLADPDRDWHTNPPTPYEQRRWLTRRARVIEPGSDDARLLDEVWKNNEGLRKDMGRIAPRPRAGFIPTRLERWHDKQVQRDREAGIVRSKSGVGLRRTRQGDEAEKPPAPLVVSRAGDLTEKVQHFLTMREDVRRAAEDVPDLSSTPGTPSVPRTDTPNVASPVSPPASRAPTQESLDEALEDILQDLVQDIEPPVGRAPPSVPHVDLDDADTEKDKDTEKDGEGSSSRGKTGQGDGDESHDEVVQPPPTHRRMVAESDVPAWFAPEGARPIPLDVAAPMVSEPSEDRPDDGRRPLQRTAEALPEGDVRALYKEALRDVLPMKRPNSVDDTFERDRRLKEITEKWKSRNVAQLSTPEPDNLWDRTVTRVASFKERAVSLWSKRVAPSIGLETPQQRVTARAKAQDLQEIKKLIHRLEASTPKPRAKVLVKPMPAPLPPPAPPSPGKKRR